MHSLFGCLHGEFPGYERRPLGDFGRGSRGRRQRLRIPPADRSAGDLFQLRFRQGQELAVPDDAEPQCGYVLGLYARSQTVAGRQPQLRLQPAGRLEQRHVAVYLFLRHAPDLPAGTDGTREDAAVLCHNEDTQSPGHAPRDGLLRAGDIQPFRRPRQRIRARQPATGLRLLLRRPGRGGGHSGGLGRGAARGRRVFQVRPAARRQLYGLAPFCQLPAHAPCRAYRRCRARKGPCGIPEGGAGGRRGDRDQYGECRREDLGHLFQSVGRDQPELERGRPERFDGIRTDRVRGSAAGEVFQALRQRRGHCRRCGRRDGRPEGAIPWNPSGDGFFA